MIKATENPLAATKCPAPEDVVDVDPTPPDAIPLLKPPILWEFPVDEVALDPAADGEDDPDEAADAEDEGADEGALPDPFDETPVEPYDGTAVGTGAVLVAVSTSVQSTKVSAGETDEVTVGIGA